MFININLSSQKTASFSTPPDLNFKIKQEQDQTHLYSSPFQRVERLYTSESDVCRRQILTYKNDPRALKEFKYLYWP